MRKSSLILVFGWDFTHLDHTIKKHLCQPHVSDKAASFLEIEARTELISVFGVVLHAWKEGDSVPFLTQNWRDTFTPNPEKVEEIKSAANAFLLRSSVFVQDEIRSILANPPTLFFSWRTG